MTEQESLRRSGTWSGFIGGLLLAVAIGLVANFIAGVIALSTGSKPLGLIIGATPGLLMLWLFVTRFRYHSLGWGLITGASVVTLIGGLCGAALTGS